jgi:hypothetical protein
MVVTLGWWVVGPCYEKHGWWRFHCNSKGSPRINKKNIASDSCAVNSGQP